MQKRGKNSENKATVPAADAIGEKVKNGFDDAKREYTVKAMEFTIVLAIFRAPKDNPESPLQEIGYTTVRYAYNGSCEKGRSCFVLS